MRKIALVVPSLTRGGGVPAVARFVKDAALRSGRYDIKPISLCMSGREATSLQITQPKTWLRGATTVAGEWEGIPYTHVGANWGELEFQRYKPRKILKDALGDCDLIQVVSGSSAWANSVLDMGKPVSLQVATRTIIERRMKNNSATGAKAIWQKGMTAIVDKYDNIGLKSVNAIQVENPWMLEYASQLNSGRDVDIRYAPPGVDTKKFHPLEKRDLESDPYILCVGRLKDPRKNIDLLLEAYSLLPKPIIRRVSLVLAGSSGPDEAFWNKVSALGLGDRVFFKKFPSSQELVELYQKASVFALSSDEEGLGVVILEAMASGIPVVSTKSGGPDGIITHGYNGYLAPLGDKNAMAASINNLLENKSLNVLMGRIARKTATSRYDEFVAGEEFIAVWDKFL